MKRALVISLICVLGLAFTGLAASLSGSWDTDIGIDPQLISFTDAITIDSVLIVVYTVGDWAFTSTTTLDEDGWVGQTFGVGGVLGAFTIASDLIFDPDNAEFTSWGVDTGVSIAGVSFTVAFDLVPDATQLVLGAIGVAGDVGVGVSVTFGDLITGLDNDGCDLDWAGVVISLDFPFCCADITSVISFDCTGFKSIVFSAGGIAIPNLPWVTIGATLTFTVDEKNLVLKPTFDFGTIVCFDLDISVTSTNGTLGAPLSLDSIQIDGISLICDIGAIKFTGVSDFNGGLGPDADHLDYWEYYTIETTDDGCCGPFSFDVSFYFEDGTKLFDVGYIDANMSLQVATQFAFTMGLGIDVENNDWSAWTIGFEVTW